MYGAAEAHADGVVDAVVPADKLDSEAMALAESIAANGPVAVRLAKQSIEGGWDVSMDEALALEWQCYEGVLTTKDREEALAAFAEKRPPRYSGK